MGQAAVPSLVDDAGTWELIKREECLVDERLQEYGHRRVENVGDDNCQYAAVINNLQLDVEAHQFRQMVCDRLEEDNKPMTIISVSVTDRPRAVPEEAAVV